MVFFQGFPTCLCLVNLVKKHYTPLLGWGPQLSLKTKKNINFHSVDSSFISQLCSFCYAQSSMTCLNLDATLKTKQTHPFFHNLGVRFKKRPNNIYLWCLISHLYNNGRKYQKYTSIILTIEPAVKVHIFILSSRK